MTVHREPLTYRQSRVLAWVADGCPAGVWDDHTYKRSVYALADRGLVTVDRRRDSWSAQVTDDGRYYLEHRQYRTAPTRHKSGGSASRGKGRNTEAEVAPADLLAALESGDGVLTVPDPAPAVRASYRRAISRLTVEGAVPDGYVLHHTGRDRGDLVIRLLPREDDATRKDRPAPVPIPDSLASAHAAVRALRDERPELLDVTAPSRPRALLVLQATADECDRRGHEFGLRPDGSPTFLITAQGIAVGFEMLEELESRTVVDEDELAEAKYPWQRVRSTVQKVPSGRLVVRTGPSYSPAFWADRKRWSLADRLPDLFDHVEQTAQETIERQARQERERKERRQEWEQAKIQARRLYVEDLNRRRLDDQLTGMRRAEDLRRYAEAIDRQAGGMDDAGRALLARQWAQWARTEADRVDPLLDPENLAWVEPEQVRESDLDALMPRGMSVWRPPQ